MLVRLPLLALTASLVACGSAPTPTPAAPPSDVGPPVASDSPPGPGSAGAATEAPARKERPLDLVSACPHDVKLYYGDQPGDGKGTNATVGAGATLQVPRGPDGAVVVWVVDERGGGLASVHVTHRMKHIKIDAACGRIDAD
jgi:hypothetical protein